jgi:hypothetical protein
MNSDPHFSAQEGSPNQKEDKQTSHQPIPSTETQHKSSPSPSPSNTPISQPQQFNSNDSGTKKSILVNGPNFSNTLHHHHHHHHHHQNPHRTTIHFNDNIQSQQLQQQRQLPPQYVTDRPSPESNTLASSKPFVFNTPQPTTSSTFNPQFLHHGGNWSDDQEGDYNDFGAEQNHRNINNVPDSHFQPQSHINNQVNPSQNSTPLPQLYNLKTDGGNQQGVKNAGITQKVNSLSATHLMTPHHTKSHTLGPLQLNTFNQPVSTTPQSTNVIHHFHAGDGAHNVNTFVNTFSHQHQSQRSGVSHHRKTTTFIHDAQSSHNDTNTANQNVDPNQATITATHQLPKNTAALSLFNTQPTILGSNAVSTWIPYRNDDLQQCIKDLFEKLSSLNRYQAHSNPMTHTTTVTHPHHRESKRLDTIYSPTQNDQTNGYLNRFHSPPHHQNSPKTLQQPLPPDTARDSTKGSRIGTVSEGSDML